MTVPTEKDWGDYHSDLDREYAHGIFAGHTNEEMQPHFRANVIERTGDLRFMPEIPFRYYMIGLRDFVMGGILGISRVPMLLSSACHGKT